MTLAPYPKGREGEVQELGFGVRNGSHNARSRPVEASREGIEGPVKALQPKIQLVAHPVEWVSWMVAA